MAGYIEHIVDAAHDPEIAVFIFARAITSEVGAGDLRPILLHIAVRIAIDRTQHAGPGLPNDEESARPFWDRLTVHRDDLGDDSEERTGSGTWFGRNRTRNRRDHDGSGFGLPPSVDDRAPVVTNDLPVPHPGFRIDRFTDRPEEAQAIHFVLFRPFISPLDESADRCGSGVKHVHMMTVDNRPETVGLGKIGGSFVHQAGGTVLQWSVNNVAVPGNPPDIGCAPIGVFLFEVEDVLGRQIGADGIAARGMNNAFRLSGGTRGVEDIERVLGIERFRWTVVGGLGYEVMPPVVAT